MTSSRHPVRRNHILSSLLKLQQFSSSSVYYCSILCAQSADQKKKTQPKSKKNDKSIGSILPVEKPSTPLPQQQWRVLGDLCRGSRKWLKPPKAYSFCKNGLRKSCGFAKNEKDIEATRKDKKTRDWLLFSMFLLVPSSITSLVITRLVMRE